METEKLNRLLEILCQEIGGDWLLTGGSLVRLEIDPARGTEDVDLVNIRHDRLDAVPLQTELFLKARSIGLGPDAVNSAAAFFVKQVPNWQAQVVQIKSGTAGRIFRPTLTLFAYLKLARGSDVDLADVRAAVGKYGAGEFDLHLFESWAPPELRAKFARLAGSLGLAS